jgi:hypothetical protein
MTLMSAVGQVKPSGPHRGMQSYLGRLGGTALSETYRRLGSSNSASTGTVRSTCTVVLYGRVQRLRVAPVWHPGCSASHLRCHPRGLKGEFGRPAPVAMRTRLMLCGRLAHVEWPVQRWKGGLIGENCAARWPKDLSASEAIRDAGCMYRVLGILHYSAAGV